MSKHGVRVELQCQHCGRSFQKPATKSDAKYCSQKCMGQAYSVAWVELQCEHCRQPFQKPPSQAINRRFCSKKCQNDARIQTTQTATKVCTRCGISKDRNAFAANKRTNDKLTSWCKECRAEYQRSRLDIIRVQTRERRAQNREEVNAANRAYYKENIEHMRQQKRIANHRRRASEADIEGRYTWDDIIALYEAQEGICAYCDVTIGWNCHIDHMTPITRGGTNWPNNLCLACDGCNQSKQDATAEEFQAYLANIEHDVPGATWAQARHQLTACRACRTIDRKHHALGLCETCYRLDRRSKGLK